MSQQDQVEEELERQLRRADSEQIVAFLYCAGQILLAERHLPKLGPLLNAATLALFTCSAAEVGAVKAALDQIIADTSDTPESFLLSALSWTLSAQQRLLNKKHNELAHHATTRAANFFARANPQYALDLLHALEPAP